MAYDVSYYFEIPPGTVDEPADPAALLDELVAALGADADVHDATLIGRTRGDDWASGDLEHDGEDSGIHLELRADADDWSTVGALPGAPTLVEPVGVLVATLSSGTHWPTVEAIRTRSADLWQAAEHDESDGFTGR